MPGDAPAAAAAAAAAKGRASSTSSAINLNAGAPPNQGLRRAYTIDETSTGSPRSSRRPTLAPQYSSNDGLNTYNSSSASSPNTAAPRRPSSTYSLGEARDIISPQASGGGDLTPHEPSSLASLSLAFALLPALAGVLFQNGGALVTDLMLLGLAGIFLNWSVTQPWNWYHAAQEVRIKNEESIESAIEDDSEFEDLPPDSRTGQKLDKVPEEDRDETSTDDTNKTSRPSTPTGGEPSVAGDAAPARPPTKPSITAEQKSAIRELYIYETTALAACFGFPLLAAYLLHALRAQLSRPSEGLVSNYNLTIFCLASELRAFSHIFKLVQCRTLHLQRVVHKNAQELTSRSASTDTTRKLDGILERLAKLETSAPLTTTQDRNDTAAVDPVASTADKWKQEAAMVQQLRASVQPELDALNRAVRRYEKKATLLEMQVQSRFGAVEARLDDSIALAAAAARDSSASRRSAGLGLKGAIVWLVDGAIRAAFWPVNTLVRIALLPVDAATALFAAASGTSTTRESAATSTRRGAGRPGTTVLVGQPRQGGRDGVPSRVGRR